MPKFVVTYTGKNTPTEETHLLHKSLVFHAFSRFLAVIPSNKLIDIMEDDDDVQNIWHNWEE